MRLFPHDSIEYSIIEKLQKESLSPVFLIGELRKKKPSLTKQAVYQAIRKLRQLEIVIVSTQRVSLSSVWIDKMHEFFIQAKNAYQGTADTERNYREDFLSMEDGDKITYVFKTHQHVEAFWNHTSNALRRIMPADEPLYIYAPHEWAMLVRQETERRLMKLGQEEGHPWYFYVPYKDPLDEYIRQFFNKPSLLYNNEKHYFKENIYINTHGDYIIEVATDPKTQKSIDDFYKTYSVWDGAAKARLNFIVSHMKGKNKLTISRNAKKASKYKQLFKKYFPMPV